jgi:ribosomal protein S18 acetylase RimI-like enzyme
MPEISIRSAISEDIDNLSIFEHGYYTDYVWQMSLDLGAEKMQTTFQRVRLPRQVFVSYPSQRESIFKDLNQAEALLVAIYTEKPVGYIKLLSSKNSGVIRVSDLVVSAPIRRHGIASGLMLASMDLCTNRGFHTLVLEVQSKNDPAIRMANKLGFNFCGFQDHYFPNQELALFFSRFTR